MVNPWKISRTPSQNTWETKGSESLWEPRAEPGKEGTPNQILREPRMDQDREEEGGEKHLELSLPRTLGGEQLNLTRWNARTPLSRLWARDILGWGGLSSLHGGFPLDGGLAGSNFSV
jgi:hypothetical protein